MSVPAVGDTSTKSSTYIGAPDLSEDDDLTGAASFDAKIDEQQGTKFKNNSRDIQRQDSSSHSQSLPPQLDTTHHTELIERQDAPSILPYIPPQRPGAPPSESMQPSEPADYNMRDPTHAQQQTTTLHSAIGSASPILKDRNSRGLSTSDLLRKQCEEMRRKQEGINAHKDGPTRQPEPGDFPHSIVSSILPAITKTVEHCVLLLNQYAGTETSLDPLARSLHADLAETTFISIRGPQVIYRENIAYRWGDLEGNWETGFIGASSIISEDIIRDSLMAKCNFRSRNIAILGYGQGGVVALAAAALWNNIEFGGVISIGGSVPMYVSLSSTIRAKTPALIMSGAIGEISTIEIQQIEETFVYTDLCEVHSTIDVLMTSPDDLERLIGFLAHRLRRDEWNKQAVISFGKIRTVLKYYGQYN